MSQIRVAGTKPEKVLRGMLKEMIDAPISYNVRDLVGKPDIIVPRFKLAVFVDGCFWHGCPEHGKMPKSHKAYWIPKIVGNMLRDEENTIVLEEQGWTVWRIWEHDLQPDSVAKTRRRLARRLKKLMGL